MLVSEQAPLSLQLVKFLVHEDNRLTGILRFYCMCVCVFFIFSYKLYDEIKIVTLNFHRLFFHGKFKD